MALEKKRNRNWSFAVKGSLLLGLAILWLGLMAVAWGEAAEAADAESEYSFRWLDPDKRVTVLQNRKYTKALKPMLSVMGGVGLSNPYRNTYIIDPRVSFYFFEWLGIEAFYSFGFNQQNNTFQSLVNSNPGTFPVIREITSSVGGSVQFVPWYAKINVFNFILNFDWYFYAGAGMINSNLSSNSSGSVSATQSLFSAHIGTGQIFYLHQNFVVRLDFKGTFYSAPAFGTFGSATLFSNYDFGLGLGVKL